MRLLFLYGPPAAGKLTVARELTVRTGYKLLHKHLTVDLATALFEFGTEPYLRLVRQLRLDIVALAAREGLDGLILTYVYHRHSSPGFLERLHQTADQEHIDLSYVRLTCDRARLEERAAADDRRKYGKISSVEQLRTLLDSEPLLDAIPGVPNVTVDTSGTPPDEAAEQICACLGL